MLFSPLRISVSPSDRKRPVSPSLARSRWRRQKLISGGPKNSLDPPPPNICRCPRFPPPHSFNKLCDIKAQDSPRALLPCSRASNWTLLSFIPYVGESQTRMKTTVHLYNMLVLSTAAVNSDFSAPIGGEWRAFSALGDSFVFLRIHTQQTRWRTLMASLSLSS